MKDCIERLVGKKIQKIFMNEDYLKFETNGGPVVFYVSGDCCSHSYFHDFIGVKKLLENGKVMGARAIPLGVVGKNKNYDEVIQSYGYEIVTENPTFGEQTSVFSFRNSSNGYYGGEMSKADPRAIVLPEVTDDVIEAVPHRRKKEV